MEMIDPNNNEIGQDGVCIRQILRSWSLSDTLQEFFNNVQQDVVDLLMLELPPEGAITQYLLVPLEFLLGDLLQGGRVVLVCGDQNIILTMNREEMIRYLPAVISRSAIFSGPTSSSSFILWQSSSIIPGMSYLSAK